MSTMRINIKQLRRLIIEALDNAYSVLGIEPGASDVEIRHAWRQLVFQYRSDRAGGDPWATVKINHVNKAMRHLLGQGKESGDPMYTGYEGPSVATPKAPREAPPAETSEPLPDVVTDKATRRAKDSYKVYPWKDKRKVVRVDGQLYGTGPGGTLDDGSETTFTGGERAAVDFSPEDDGRLTIKKQDSNHSQTWNPVDEVRKIIDELVIESLLM